MTDSPWAQAEAARRPVHSPGERRPRAARTVILRCRYFCTVILCCHLLSLVGTHDCSVGESEMRRDDRTALNLKFTGLAQNSQVGPAV